MNVNEGGEHPLAESGIKDLPQSITTAMSGYLDVSDPELQADLAKVGYKPFTPEDVEWDKEVLLERLAEAIDSTSKLPPIIKIGNSWFTRNTDIVKEITEEYKEETKEFTQI